MLAVSSSPKIQIRFPACTSSEYPEGDVPASRWINGFQRRGTSPPCCVVLRIDDASLVRGTRSAAPKTAQWVSPSHARTDRRSNAAGARFPNRQIYHWASTSSVSAPLPTIRIPLQFEFWILTSICKSFIYRPQSCSRGESSRVLIAEGTGPLGGRHTGFAITPARAEPRP